MKTFANVTKVAALAMALVLLFAACGAPAASTSEEPAASTSEAASSEIENAEEDKTQMEADIRYFYWDEGQRPGMEEQIAKFNEKYPNIHVDLQMTAFNQYWEKLPTEIAGGTAPDLFMNTGAWFRTLQDANAAEPLTPLIERDGYDMNGHMPQLIENYSDNGVLYAMPRDCDTIALIYNKDLFDEKNIPYPDDTLEWNPVDGGSFTELAQKMTTDKNGKNALDPDFDKYNIEDYGFISQNANNVFYWNFMLMNGGNIEDYTTPKNVETMQWAQDLFYKYNVSPAYASVATSGRFTLFASGNVAMYTEGNWKLKALLNECNFNVGITVLPKGPDGRAALMNGNGESIYSGSKNKEATWEFLKFLGSGEAQEILASGGTVNVSRMDYGQPYFDFWKEQGIDPSAYQTTFATYDLSMAPIVPFWNEKSDAINKNYDLMMRNEITSQEAADAIGAVYASLDK